jgi:hypothetical protein
MKKSKRRNSIHKNNSKISLGLSPNNPTTSFHAKSDSTTPPPPHLYLQHTVSYRSSTLAIKCICLQQYPEVHMLLRSMCLQQNPLGYQEEEPSGRSGARGEATPRVVMIGI